MNAENLVSVAGQDLIDAHATSRAVCNYRALLLATVID